MDSENHGQQNTGNNAPHVGAGSTVNPSAREAQGARTALRRRLVLGGMVGVPAALTVMKPVRTLAKAKKVACSYSGWHSFKLNSKTSAHPKNQYKCKSGYNQKVWYKEAKKKLPKSKKYGNNYFNKILNHNGSLVYVYKTTTFSSLFGSGTTSTIWTVISGSSNQYSIFLTALWNAYWYHGAGYPYSCADIYKLWGQYPKNPDIATYLHQLDSFA